MFDNLSYILIIVLAIVVGYVFYSHIKLRKDIQTHLENINRKIDKNTNTIMSIINGQHKVHFVEQYSNKHLINPDDLKSQSINNNVINETLSESSSIDSLSLNEVNNQTMEQQIVNNILEATGINLQDGKITILHNDEEFTEDLKHMIQKEQSPVKIQEVTSSNENELSDTPTNENGEKKEEIKDITHYNLTELKKIAKEKNINLYNKRNNRPKNKKELCEEILKN